MTAHIPSALRSYTAQQSEVQVEGATLAEALAGLQRRFPGIRFRIITEQDTIRPHIRIFVNATERYVDEAAETPVLITKEGQPVAVLRKAQAFDRAGTPLPNREAWIARLPRTDLDSTRGWLPPEW